jgi:hypothetical protein
MGKVASVLWGGGAIISGIADRKKELMMRNVRKIGRTVWCSA